MQRLGFLLGVLSLTGGTLAATEFTVMAYNVENLFDLDRVAIYADYEQAPGGTYGVPQLLAKLENIRRSLAAVNGGAGPEVVLFQEFELDRTPFGTPGADAFLAATRGRPLAQLLRDDPATHDLPSALLLLKHLEDNGMGGYRIAQPDPSRMEDHTVQQNVVFSRFPVTSIRQRPMLNARDLLVVVLDVEGKELVLLNNHWKSGASDHATEPVRIQNARVLRAELEAILFRNPQADVIIAGDLNCYYNHKAAHADQLPVTAVNDVLESGDREDRMPGADGYRLYNLWNELPPQERGSEVYRGYWGTLMQMILTPGLYDNRGIQYVDNSFSRLQLPGVNADERWGRPISWTNFGGGHGFSDHLPIQARFKVVAGEGGPGWMELQQSAWQEPVDPAYRPKVEYRRLNRMALPPVGTLAGMDEAVLASRRGELFQVDQALAAGQPARIRVGDLELEIYSPLRDIRDRLNSLAAGQRVQACAELAVWRGRLQLVVQDSSWLPAVP